MCDSRLGLALAVMFLAVLAGCSKPAASLPEDRVAAEERTAAPQPAAAAENPQSDAAEEPELAAADSAQLPPTAQVAFDDAEDSPAAVPAVQVALATEPADALFRRRMLDLLAEARAAATVLEAHGSTESFDRHCRRLKNLLEDARLADEDDQFEAISARAHLVLQQLRLARLLLAQRDQLAGPRTPGEFKLLRDTIHECSRAARDQQAEIARLRQEVEGR